MERAGGYIMNLETKEKMELRVEDGTYVFDVKLDDGTYTTITFDTGAGINVWPKDMNGGNGPNFKKDNSVKMAAANGTPIEHYGKKNVVFKGKKAGDEEEVFRGRM